MRTGPAVRIVALALAGFAGAAPAHEPLGFAVEIVLSPKAAARLRATHEGITADARYYGNPSAAAVRHADEVGQIDLGNERHRLPGRTGPARFSGAKVAVDRLDWIEGGVKVNVNLYSSRRSSQDNILACDFIDASLAAVFEAQPIVLRCGLITENPATRLRPRPSRRAGAPARWARCSRAGSSA